MYLRSDGICSAFSGEKELSRLYRAKSATGCMLKSKRRPIPVQSRAFPVFSRRRKTRIKPASIISRHKGTGKNILDKSFLRINTP
jgi:hypothetical protein